MARSLCAKHLTRVWPIEIGNGSLRKSAKFAIDQGFGGGPRRRSARSVRFRARSFGDPFHLPVLQVDHRAAAEKLHHGHELIPLPSADHLTDHAGQGPGRVPGRLHRPAAYLPW